MDKIRAEIAKRYFFVIRWPDRDDDDEEGTLFLSRSAALAYGERIVRELKEAGGYDDDGLTLIVQNEMRKTIYTIPF